ncbi:DNA polymerase Y family protein [uncultured Devosia sp.]|uniref:Y-family DNA polymerase n=1 Tax=uncultured Devosia sp. TaxID=211434 RepID=UPI00260DE7AB|nr:DNA polymerase Y family protein [uncultured Devosia sp.]
MQPSLHLERRFLCLHLPYWPTQYLKRVDPDLKAPLVLYEKIKGGLRLVALDPDADREGLRLGQALADARAMVPSLTVMEQDSARLASAFAAFADWHSNASPLVTVLQDKTPFGDLILDITGVAHLFGGEAAMLDMVLSRLQTLNYTVSGAIAPTIGAAWAVSHSAKSAIISTEQLVETMDGLPVAALRLEESQISLLAQMGLKTIGELRTRPRKPLLARFGASLILRLDQAYGHIEERMTPRLPPAEHFVDRKFFEPISTLEDVLLTTEGLAQKLARRLEVQGLGAQTFHLFLYRVDHKVMTLSLNAARLTRDAEHIASLFRHRAQRLEQENYDPGFGIDLVRLAAASLDRLDPGQTGVFETDTGARDIEQLTDRLASRLGTLSVLKTELMASHIPEQAARLVPALVHQPQDIGLSSDRHRPLRLLPQPEPVAINAEVPDGLPASMIWRRQQYRLIKAAGPERISAEWWRSGKRLELVPAAHARSDEPGEKPKPSPYMPDLPPFDPMSGMRDYYVVEDGAGHRFWVFRQGLYGGSIHPVWYLHGIFP